MRTGAFLATAKEAPQTAPRSKPSRHASPRGLTAMALLIAGALIAAQALYIPAKAQVAQALMSNAWAQQLKTGDLARPWPWADFAPTAKLSFPNQNRSVLAVTDASGESLAFGPTLMAASVKPGSRGVAVFAAHRDTHFAFLKDVQPGDEITVELQDGARRFRVTGSQVVRWDASGIQTQDGGTPRIALITCWPLDAKTPGPMRYVVWAELIPEPLSASTPSQA
ncbi:MAG: class GN sortase [Alphaproteobacteria bacterium]|nr:MAG: class GN sortase [Alphaproteobacteria bacterium]